MDSWKDGHEDHSLSQGEVHCFYCYEWSDRILSIKQQFPMELAETRRIAKLLGFVHPKDRQGEDVQMTTDFRLIVKSGQDAIPFGRTFKRKQDLRSARLFEKLEIERVYHEEHDIDWGIVTDADVPPGLLEVADWVHDCRDIEELKPLRADEMRTIARHLSKKLSGVPTVILAVICTESDEELGLEPATSLKVCRFLIANKLWRINPFDGIDTGKPIAITTRKLPKEGGSNVSASLADQ